MPSKVLVSDPLPQDALQRIRAAGIVVDERAGMTPEELERTIGDYDAIVVRSATKIRRQHLAAAGRLKLIVRGGVGLDNVDVAAAAERGVRVLNTPGAASVSVAELALGLIFALARRIPEADASMKAGRWEKKAFSKGLEVEGRTLGIIGMGRIGRVLARKASAIGLMAIAAYDKFPSGTLDLAGCTLTTKADLLHRADFVSLHIPFEPGDPPEIGAAELAQMKDGVFVVNCARGGVVDEGALYDALESGKVSGAALDVLREEPPKDLRLVRHPRVICTPHVGAGTIEGQGRVGREVAEILLRELGSEASP